MLLVRISRRKTTWEDPLPDISEILTAEFRDADANLELTQSVYWIEDDRMVQVALEHAAGAGVDPPRSKKHLDISCYSGRKDDTPAAQDYFRYSDEAHRDIRFAFESELIELIELAAKNESRCLPVTKKSGQNFVRERLKSQDAEWRHFASNHAKGSKYQKWSKFKSVE